MFVVGLTGGIGSGKSQVTHVFETLGIEIIFEKIIDHFGINILNQDNTLNRHKLRHIIFQNSEEKKWLEQLLHPLIRIAVKEKIKHSISPYCIVEIPLLFESAQDPYKTYILNRILVVDTEEKNQLLRTQKRDNASQEHVENIIAQQISREKRLTLADDIITNNDDIETLKAKVKKLHEYYLTFPKKSPI